MASPGSTTKESRHLWVGGLPDTIDESKIKDYFSKFGKVEGVKILPQKFPKIGLAAFVDFYDVRSAVEAKEAKHKLNGQELRTNFKTKQSEKFGESGPRKWSDDELEGKKGNELQHRSSSSRSDTGSEDSRSSSSESESEDKTRRKKLYTFLKITGLPKRPERVLQDGLYYEYTRYSPAVEIKMYGSDSEKWAVAKFKKAEKCHEARKQTQGIALFGNKIKVTPLDLDDFPPGGRDEPALPSSGNRSVKIEDIDPQATRSLFVGNIPKNISVYDVRDAFQRYGNILDVEIKKMGGTATYGFVLYYDLSSAITAKKYMDGQNIKGNNIRVGFGKGTNSKQLWIDGVDSSLSRQQLERHMSKYGKIIRLGIDYQRSCAMVQYDSIDSAKKALEAVKGTHIGNSRKLMTDFANRDARAAFFSHMDRMELEGSHQHFPGPAGMYGPGMMDPGFRGGMMMPGGMPMMSMGRAGYHPGGPPMDYMYDPYLEGGMGYYGGRPPFHPGRGHPVHMGMGPYPGGQYEDDYDEELAAYKRKRDWEKEREKKKGKKKQKDSSSDSSTDSDDSSHKKKRKDKHRRGAKKQKRKSKKTEDHSESESSSDEGRDEIRQKATQKSKEHREKIRKKASPSRSIESDSDSKKKKESDPLQTSNGDSQDDEEITLPVPKAKLKAQAKTEKIAEKKVKPPSPPSVSPSPPRISSSDKKPSEKPPSPPKPSPGGTSDRRVSATSSFEETSRKSSIDEEPTTETPQSPTAKKVVPVQVESDWSSGDEFKSSDNNDKPPGLKSPEVELKREIRAKKEQEISQVIPKRSHESQPSSDNDQNDRVCSRNKPARHLPRKYQVESDHDIPRKEMHRPRDPRSEKRFGSGPSSPSPPPSSYAAHRRRPHYSPPPEQFERQRHRKSRPYSPRGHRRYSRSPQRFHSPSPRPRSPPRSKEVHGRHRYDSPPGEPRGGRYSHRGSPHSPPSHRFQRSTSPSFPRSPGRKRLRHRTPSLSPPRRSPGRGYKRDKSPVQDSGRISPRYRSGKRGNFSRTPSPKAKFREIEEKSEYKRRRIEESRPKSPSTNLPPVKVGASSQLASQSVYPSHHTHPSLSASLVETSAQRSPGQRVVEAVPPKTKPPPSEITHASTDNLLDLLRRYPVMWQGHLTLKNDSAAVQLHFLSGNVQLAKLSLPQPTEQSTPSLKIAQRMRLEKTQLEGVGRRIQNDGEHCLLLALPCGRDPSDVHQQTNALKNTFITYLIQKQAAGIINVPAPSPQSGFVLHIFPPCPFSQAHLSRVAPDLLSSASDNCHLMIVVATM